MPDFRPVLFVIGIFLVVLGAMMIVPALLAIWNHGPDWQGFLLSAAICEGVGFMLIYRTHRIEFLLTSRQMFLLTSLSWIAISAFSALPLMFSQLQLTYTDAFFEAISGITTTGSTVLVGLDYMPRDILLWRALLQWLGGIGIIVMAIAILPFIRVGGMRLFQTESSDRSEKPFARAASTAKAIGSIYLALTALCAFAYWQAGMTLFEAIIHAMTTLSTGGYSTSDSSLGHFPQPAIHWIATLFMVLGGLPFVQYARLIRGDYHSLWYDRQVRAFLTFLFIVILVMTLDLYWSSTMTFEYALRMVALNVTSVLTTTGYASTDYTTWGQFAIVSFFFLTFVGACSGSTSGGIKIFRFQVAYLLLRNQLYKLIHPYVVMPLRYNDRAVSNEIVYSLVGFSFFFAVSVALLALALALTGLDLVTSLSGAATAIANVGPGLGDIIGPVGNFATLPNAAKWLLCFGMLIGRLEIMTVLVLFVPTFWRG
jgi:trk system potassium uptake protein TrkH